MKPALLTASSLTLELGNKLLCSDLDLTIEAGQSWGLLGRNGAGKTTLLQSLMGVRPVDAGRVSVAGNDITAIARRELATRVGMLFQEGMDTLPASVLETVMLGRHPHNKSLFNDSEEDKQIALQALRSFDLEDYSKRKLDTLSGGEQQRLALAMLYTQRPDLYLLDEPSNHLDVAFQIRLLSRFSELVKLDGASLLMATHDINLAARFCDHIILLMDEGEHCVGTTEEILTEENLSRAYQCKIRKLKEGQMTLFYPDED